MHRCFAACFILGFLGIAATDEAEDVWKLMEQSIRERAGTEELANRILAEARIVRSCGLEHSELGVAVLKKMFVQIASEGTECANTKSGIADASERNTAIKRCFKDAADYAKRLSYLRASITLTDEEATVFDAIRACVVKGLETLKH